MIKKLQLVGIAGAIVMSIIILLSPGSVPLPEPTISTDNNAVQIIATNLNQPRSIAFGNEQIYISEKNGNVRIIQNDTLLDEPLITFRVADVFDGGLLGLETHPNFSNNNFLYVYYTYQDGQDLWNKISRLHIVNNTVLDVITIIDKIPGSKFSNGGVIKFGPDGKLYAATGVKSDSSHNSQDISKLDGKILRINDDGSVPIDNPFPDSFVFSYGHRNPQGLAWNSLGELFAAELGPAKNDEINIIKPGANYGWPIEECTGHFVNAHTCFDPAIEPGGIIFYHGDKFDLNDMLIMSSLRFVNLYKIDTTQDGAPKSILGGIGRIRDVAVGPDDYLYIITSNTDGKGFPIDTDDRLLRIVK